MRIREKDKDYIDKKGMKQIDSLYLINNYTFGQLKLFSYIIYHITY